MRQQLKRFETRKLFFAEYLYKLVLRNDLSSIFRTELQGKEKLNYARTQLDQLTENYRNNLPLYKKAWRADVLLHEDEYFDAMTIYNALKNSNDYKIRIDNHSQITLFSNNRKMLLDIANKLHKQRVDFWEPKQEHLTLLTGKTQIKIVNVVPELELKVYFNSKRVNAEFANWIDANRDKCKIGEIAFSSIQLHGYLSGFYMYVRDEKVLNLVMLLAGNSIRNVEKLVYVPDIDK
jgi:hypothetical protein